MACKRSVLTEVPKNTPVSHFIMVRNEREGSLSVVFHFSGNDKKFTLWFDAGEQLELLVQAFARKLQSLKKALWDQIVLLTDTSGGIEKIIFGVIRRGRQEAVVVSTGEDFQPGVVLLRCRYA